MSTRRDRSVTLFGVSAEFGRVEQQQLLGRHLAWTSIAPEEELEGVSVQVRPVSVGGESSVVYSLPAHSPSGSFRASESAWVLLTESEEGLSTGQAFAVAGPGSTRKRGM